MFVAQLVDGSRFDAHQRAIDEAVGYIKKYYVNSLKSVHRKLCG